MCWCSTDEYRVTVVCVTVMCWCNKVWYMVTVVCVLLYSVGAVQLGTGFCCVCVTVMC